MIVRVTTEEDGFVSEDEFGSEYEAAEAILACLSDEKLNHLRVDGIARIQRTRAARIKAVDQAVSVDREVAATG